MTEPRTTPPTTAATTATATDATAGAIRGSDPGADFVSPGTGGQGRLAAMIAARGGRAAPEAPFVVEHREALIYMLCLAAELEHGIMCQYLFAAFTLKQSTGEGLTDDELVTVTRWRRTVAHVATQEMLHLALVNNLLTAIGAAPHFSRPNLPQPANHYPAGVELTLLPFGEAALQHFMFLERPEGMALDDAAGLAAVARAVPRMQADEIVPRLQDFATVGHLYRSIEQGVAHLVEKYGEDRVFIGPPRAQATGREFGWSELVAVSDLVSAQTAIDTILEQGEGPRGDWRSAHFGQFVNILDEYQQLTAANPRFNPVRPVVAANVRPCEHADDVPVIGDPITSRCADLFNVGYEILLQVLERYFAHTEETELQLGTLAELSISLMLRVIKPLGDLITTLPAGPEFPGRAAGPSFELFYENDYLLPHQHAAWTMIAERLVEAGGFAAGLRADADPDLSQALAPVAAALAEIADTLGAQLPGWVPVAVASADASDESWAELLDQAVGLLPSSPGVLDGAPPQPVTDPRSRLAVDAFTLLRHLPRDAPRHRPVEHPDRAALGRRLVDSVLRPLALDPPRHPVRAAPSDHAATDANPRQDDSTTPDPPGIEPVGSERAAWSSSAADQVWGLARTATRLLTQPDDSGAAAGDDPAGPWLRDDQGLFEATAALQDLAVALASPAVAAERLATLHSMCPAATPRIRCASDGPYLLTGAVGLTDHLGVPAPTRPVMALCRCGQSSSKPFCDGTHARIGFNDAKSPHRVPDRRDTYRGAGVTVLDNRGLCQHSGLCTDRLAEVFHAGGDPFITPNGARVDEIVRAVRACPSGALSFAVDGVEARTQTDQPRPPGLLVTRDGPYRVTGAVELQDSDGHPTPRPAGASAEHYALCRCGQSQNKPFCSGMHYYVGFCDPATDPCSEISLFAWAGGLPALRRLAEELYTVAIPGDPLLAALYAETGPEGPDRFVRALSSAFGGPSGASLGATAQGVDPSRGDGPGATIADGKVVGDDEADTADTGGPTLGVRFPSNAHRARWVALFSQAADHAQLPSDAAFRSAFAAYGEWASRPAPTGDPATTATRWGWTAAGPPPVTDPAPGAVADELAPAAAMTAPAPGPDEPVSFDAHIRPLFRDRDRRSMRFAFDLWSHDDVRAHAEDILDRLADGSMPCDGAWTPEQLGVFRRWIDTGTPL